VVHVERCPSESLRKQTDPAKLYAIGKGIDLRRCYFEERRFAPEPFDLVVSHTDKATSSEHALGNVYESLGRA
jgi:hypothetical protein